MTDANIPKSRSDQSDQSDPFGILALFRSDMPQHLSDRSDHPVTLVLAGPTGPTGPTTKNHCRTEKDKQNQCGPTGPTGPTTILPYSATATLSDADALDFLDRYEERAAIREYDGGQPRSEAEAAALAEAAKGAGLTTDVLRKLWAEHPDAKAYLAYLSSLGPTACGEVACALRWDSTRAWQAEARLRASGLVTLDSEGRAEVRKGKDQK
jgi:hypothetical protein